MDSKQLRVLAKELVDMIDYDRSCQTHGMIADPKYGTVEEKADALRTALLEGVRQEDFGDREKASEAESQLPSGVTNPSGLRGAIAPFVRLARGIPDNWHGELTLLIEQFGNGIRIKSCPVMDFRFPLIADWWALIDAYDAPESSMVETIASLASADPSRSKEVTENPETSKSQGGNGE